MMYIAELKVVFTIFNILKDLQIIDIKLRVILRPNLEKLADLYRLLGLNYSDRVLLSVVYEICGGVIVISFKS